MRRRPRKRSRPAGKAKNGLSGGDEHEGEAREEEEVEEVEEEEEGEEEEEEGHGKEEEQRPVLPTKARREKTKRDIYEDVVPSWDMLGARLNPSQELQERTVLSEQELAFADL